MREIKFRIWNKTTKKYIYSDEFEYLCDTFKLKAFFDYIEHYKVEWMNEFGDIEQFTCLRDKKNKPIYKGDILTDYNSVGEIIWQHDHCRFSWKTGECYLPMIDDEALTIIGNINENSDLLCDYKK